MPAPTSEAAWWGSLLWLLGLAAVAFGVAWLSGTRLHIRKGPYIPLLFVATAGMSAAYIRWLGMGAGAVLARRWGWGLLAGAVMGLLLVRPASRQPVDYPRHGRERAVALGWEGVVYGVAEGVLLSALPPFMAWQMAHSLGWDGVAGRWGLPILAGAAVIVIHHLGYWSCRNRILVPITMASSVLSGGFLLTASWLTPAVAHIFVHATLIVRGSEMPPHDRPADAPYVDVAAGRRAA